MFGRAGVSLALFALLSLLLVPAVDAQNSTHTVTFTFTAGPEGGADGSGDGNGTDNATAGPALILDRWHNPLPAPLDNEVGVFLLSLLAWFLLGVLTLLVIAPLVWWIAKRTPTDLDLHIVKIIRTPIIVLIFTFGLVDSLAVLPVPDWALTVLERLWRVVLVAVLVYIAYRIWHEVLRDVAGRVAKKTESRLDDKLFPLFDKLGGIVIVVVGAFFLADAFGINLTLFAAGGAIGGLVIAFAAQDTLGNLFAGIFIILDEPFREGDRIEIKEEQTWGDVMEIGLRTTRIRTRDNRMVIVPNALIGSNPVINHSFPDATYRFETAVGIAYGSDVAKAKEVIRAAVSQVDGLADGLPVEALFAGFGDSSLNFRVRYWLSSYADVRRIEDDVNTRLDAALREAGIVIPFPQRDVHLIRADGEDDA